MDAPKAVIGGPALTAWQHARSTRDADVLVALQERRFGEVLTALVAAGFHARHTPPLRVVDGQGIARFTFQPAQALMPFQFDVLLVAGDFQREAVHGPCPGRWPGRAVTGGSCGPTLSW